MKVKKIKPEIIMSAIVGLGIVVLTIVYSIPKKALVPDIKLLVATPIPKTEWSVFNEKDFGLSFEYHSSWDEPVVRSHTLERVVYVGPIVITRKSSTLDEYISLLKKQKVELKEISISNTLAYWYEQKSTNKINTESIILSKDDDSQITYEIAYSYTKEEDKEKIDKFTKSISVQ